MCNRTNIWAESNTHQGRTSQTALNTSQKNDYSEHFIFLPGGEIQIYWTVCKTVYLFMYWTDYFWIQLNGARDLRKLITCLWIWIAIRITPTAIIKLSQCWNPITAALPRSNSSRDLWLCRGSPTEWLNDWLRRYIISRQRRWWMLTVCLRQ